MNADEIAERLMRSKSVRQTEDAVVRHWLDGMSSATSANALGCSEATVEHLRRHLQLTRGQAWRGGVKPLGRTREVRLVVEVVR